MHKYLIFCFSLLLLACEQSPEPIAFGSDQCAYCKMSIADPKYGAEVISDKGRIYKFDATECMVNYLHENETGNFQKLAIAYDDPGQLHPVDSLFFIIHKDYQSPMGANLAAFQDRAAVKSADSQFLQWTDVMKKLQ
jgi:copper chaperone NosL